ncbi:MAG TPA: tetratricopeptide repeat protein, partial [Bacteroidales bacterium]|nr:tetratricopeptide repeat protein [Bacteroidales bacterium]
EASFLDALRSDSMMEAANLNLALLYGETGRMAEAEKYLEKTLDINPDNPVASYNLAILLYDTNPERARALCRISVKNGDGVEKYANLLNLLEKKISEESRK